MFEDSPVSKKILRYFSTRIGQYVAPIGLLKVLSIHSASSSYPRLSVLHEARSREWKTQTLLLAKKMFNEDFYIYIKGDKTIHSLVDDYGENWDCKCLMLNDGNLLFKSMATKSKERWLSAISVLLTEGVYEYGSRIDKFTIRGKVSLIINLTTPSYYRHKNEIFETTLGNRLFIAHAWLKEKYNLQCKKNFDNTKGLASGILITEPYNRTIRNEGEYEKELLAYAKDYAILSVRSVAETLDIVKAIAFENARINQRNYLTDDDMEIVRMFREYNIDPMVPDEPRVILGLKEGRTYTDICHLLQKPTSYKSTISYYHKKALQKGVLDAR